MRHHSLKLLAVLLLLGPVGWSVGIAQKNNMASREGLREGPPGPEMPEAHIYYRSSITTDTRTGALHSYCVYPSISIAARQGRQSNEWTLPFTVDLVGIDGRPAAPGFQPVTVPTPIPASTTLALNPNPAWCAPIAAGGSLPEIYLRVGQRSTRVVFDAPPPAPLPLPKRPAETR